LGVEPKFAFLVHPRRKEDIFIAWPFARPLRILLRNRFYSFIRHLPPTVLDVIKTPAGVHGVIVSSTWLPDALIENRKAALKEARKCIRFVAKLSPRNAYLGLGEWWPFLTKRGESVQRYAQKRGLQITTGYCGTLCSLQMSVKRIAKVSEIEPSRMSVLILGVGKMGASVARGLVNEVGRITVFDKNKVKRDRIAEELRALSQGATIGVLEDGDKLIPALATHDVCICTTSNLRRILPPEVILPWVIILDDSRPEAIPRIYDKARGILVIEGGLLRIQGAEVRYDFGFGNDGEVFGCLGEVYMLACDGGKTLKPTVGDVDFNNFRRMLASLERLGVESGGLRCGATPVDPSDIAAIIKRKHVDRGLGDRGQNSCPVCFPCPDFSGHLRESSG